MTDNGLPDDGNNSAAHGGRLLAASRQFPGARLPWIDLSTGINPWPFPVPHLAPSAWARLPEPEEIADLERAAAAHFGVADPACVIAVPGSDLAMRLLPHCLDVRRMAIVGPTYGGHMEAWAGRQAVEISFDSLPDDVDGLTVVNPNNPDGRILSAEMLEAVRRQMVARGGILIVDEAFVDAVPEAGIGGPVHSGVVVLRSFGKFFGLGGLRLGFIVADPALARRIRTQLGAWPVSGPAVAIGTIAYRDAGWIEATRQHLHHAVARLDDLFAEAGLSVVGGTPLFRLVEAGDAAALADCLARHGILVRAFSDRPQLLRFGLPADEAATERLFHALSSLETCR